jgi:hypothetical protein
MHSAFDNGPPHCSDNDGFPSELCEEAEVDIEGRIHLALVPIRI